MGFVLVSDMPASAASCTIRVVSSVQLLLPPHQFFAALRPTPLHFHDAVASLGQPPNLFR